MSAQTQAQTPAKTAVVHPLIDVLENENEFLLLADLPGVNKEQLELTVDAGQLAIVGRSEKIEYRRSFALGEDIDIDAIEASLELGALSQHLPKRAEAKVRKITIN